MSKNPYDVDGSEFDVPNEKELVIRTIFFAVIIFLVTLLFGTIFPQNEENVIDAGIETAPLAGDIITEELRFSGVITDELAALILAEDMEGLEKYCNELTEIKCTVIDSSDGNAKPP